MSTGRGKPKARTFNARSGKVLRIWVDVTKTRDGGYAVKTQDQKVKVKGEGVFIVWKLKKRVQAAWRFHGNGISFGRKGGGQFIHPYRFESGTEVALLDRNTRKGSYKYDVSLVRLGNPRLRIREDPIIENEGDGRSM